MLDSAISPVSAPGSNTPPNSGGLRQLAFDLAAVAVVAGDRATALRVIEDAR